MNDSLAYFFEAEPPGLDNLPNLPDFPTPAQASRWIAAVLARPVGLSLSAEQRACLAQLRQQMMAACVIRQAIAARDAVSLSRWYLPEHDQNSRLLSAEEHLTAQAILQAYIESQAATPESEHDAELVTTVEQLAEQPGLLFPYNAESLVAAWLDGELSPDSGSLNKDQQAALRQATQSYGHSLRVK